MLMSGFTSASSCFPPVCPGSNTKCRGYSLHFQSLLSEDVSSSEMEIEEVF